MRFVNGKGSPTAREERSLAKYVVLRVLCLQREMDPSLCPREVAELVEKPRVSPAAFRGEQGKQQSQSCRKGNHGQGMKFIFFLKRIERTHAWLKRIMEEGEGFWIGWDGDCWQSRRRAFSGMTGTDNRL